MLRRPANEDVSEDFKNKASGSNNGLEKVELTLPLTSPEEVIGLAVSALEDEATSISWLKHDDGWKIEWIFNQPAPITQLKSSLANLAHLVSLDSILVTSVPSENWLEKSYQLFPPLTIDCFYIYGSHFSGDVPYDLIPLQIDAATAFGSGTHGTTHGCLQALNQLYQSGFRPRSICDMGSGSGILAIAAYQLWKCPVLAVDIDKEATRVACYHRKINKIPSGNAGMVCSTGDGYRARRVQQHSGGFDLIIANILAVPLIIMAKDLARNLAPNGMAVLSGLLTEQEQAVLDAHTSCNLKLTKCIIQGDWHTLILKNS